MRRHFLALEAFDNSGTGAPDDGTPDPDKVEKPDAPDAQDVPDATPGAEPVAAEVPAVEPNADPAAVAAVAPASDPETPADPTAAPALPDEPKVAPPATGADAPVAAEPAAQPVSAVPEVPTNASDTPVVAEPAPAAEPAPEPLSEPGNEPEDGSASPPSGGPREPAAPVAEPAAKPSNGSVSESDDKPEDEPAATLSAPEADTEAMESLRERLALSMAMEEASVTLTEAGETSAEISHDLAESERVIQVSDALNDVAFVAGSIKEATPAEAALVEVAGDLAVAGTDVEPDAVIPSMEAYIGSTIATEGIKETAKKIWESIVIFVQKIWEKIRSFWRSTVTIPVLKAMLAKARKMLADYQDLPNDEVIKVPVGFVAFVDQSRESTLNVLTTLFEKMPGKVENKGRILLNALKSFDPKNAAESLKRLIGELESAGEERGAGIEHEAKLEGGYVLRYVSPGQGRAAPDAGSHATFAALERIRNSGYRFSKHAEGRERSLNSLVDIHPKTKPVLDAMCGKLETLLKAMERFYETHFRNLDHLGREIKVASDALVRKAGNDAGGTVDGADVPDMDYRALLNFNKTFAEWTYNPFVPAFSYASTLFTRAIVGIMRHVDASKKIGKAA